MVNLFERLREKFFSRKMCSIINTNCLNLVTNVINLKAARLTGNKRGSCMRSCRPLKHRRSHRTGYPGPDPTNFWESNMGPAQNFVATYRFTTTWTLPSFHSRRRPCIEVYTATRCTCGWEVHRIKREVWDKNEEKQADLFIYLFIHSFIYIFVYIFFNPINIHSFIYSCIHFIYICLFVYSIIHIFIYSFIHYLHNA